MSRSFANNPVDWSNIFQAPPTSINCDHHHHHHHLSTITNPNPTSFSFDSAPTPITTTTTTTNNNNKSSSTVPRVKKPVRKRSRASRRTPTTLLSTDTSNFRAMVQQFTGGPSSALGFGIDRQVITTSFPFPGSRGFQFHQQQEEVIGMGSRLSSHVSGGNDLY